MTDPDEEFHKQLLATFREEAEEHLGEITEELIALEKAGHNPGIPARGTGVPEDPQPQRERTGSQPPGD